MKKSDKSKSITQVSDGNEKNRNIFIVLIVVALILYLLSSSSTEEEEEKIEVFNPSNSSRVVNLEREKEVEELKKKVEKNKISDDDIEGLLEIINQQKIALDKVADNVKQEYEDIESKKRKSSMMIYSSTNKINPSSSDSQSNLLGISNNDTLALLGLLPDDKNEEKKAQDVPEYLNVVKVKKINNLSDVLTAGKFIKGVLETAIDSTLGGQIRAVVSNDVYSENGAQVLIDKGTRLIGEYQSGIAQGQTRVYIVWQTAITPDGYQVPLNSFGTNHLGVSGLSGDYDSHFFKRFGGALLLSIIENQTSSNNQFGLASQDSLAQASSIALESSINIPPTIYIDQGAVINIFVARNIRF